MKTKKIQKAPKPSKKQSKKEINPKGKTATKKTPAK